ncbi:hypothetical protein TNCV_2402961, partial [Trichonephila clavipes]
ILSGSRREVVTHFRLDITAFRQSFLERLLLQDGLALAGHLHFVRTFSNPGCCVYNLADS